MTSKQAIQCQYEALLILSNGNNAMALLFATMDSGAIPRAFRRIIMNNEYVTADQLVNVAIGEMKDEN